MYLTNKPVRATLSLRRRGGRLPAIGIALGLAIPVFGGEPIKTYPTVELRDGRQFSAVEVISYTPTGVLVRHTGGITTFRRHQLPEQVLVDLHLQVGAVGALFDPSLADKPAIPEPKLAELANRPAVIENSDGATVGQLPTVTGMRGGHLAENTAAPALGEGADQSPQMGPAPAGEGNLPEFFSTPNRAPTGTEANPRTIAGRVVLRLPSGETRLGGDVVVKAYPAALLPRYLEKAKARVEFEARKLIEQALVLEKSGSSTDGRAAIDRAREIGRNYLDTLPEPAQETRTDEYGHFTLHHDIPDARLVAAGRVEGMAGTWYYEWVGVVPSGETVLNEANATGVEMVSASQPKFTAR